MRIRDWSSDVRSSDLHREILVRIAPEYRCFALGITIDELIGMAAREDREANELLHHVDDPVIIAGRAHPAVLAEFLEGHGDTRLVGDRKSTRLNSSN